MLFIPQICFDLIALLNKVLRNKLDYQLICRNNRMGHFLRKLLSMIKLKILQKYLNDLIQKLTQIFIYQLSIKNHQQFVKTQCVFSFINLTNIMESFQIVSVRDERVNINLQSIARISKSSINKFVPICIIGPTLSGKSSIANRIVNKQNLFTVTATTSSCTKGLWGSFQELSVADCRINIFMIDVQGFDSMDSQIQKEVTLMCLAYLLSNIVIINSFGALDKSILSRVRSLSRYCTSNGDQKVLFLQRDFHLELKNYIGQQLDAKKYLQGCINQAGKSCQQSIKSLFSEMSMFMMTNFQQQIKFNKQIQSLRQEILRSCSSDTFINKDQLCMKLQGIAQILRQNPSECDFRRLYKTVQRIQKQTNHIYTNKYRQYLRAEITKLQLPMPEQLLRKQFEKFQENFLVKNVQNFHQLVKKIIIQLTNKQLNTVLQKNKTEIKRAIANHLEKFTFHKDFTKQFHQYLENLQNLYYNSSNELFLECSHKFLIDFCQKYINKALNQRSICSQELSLEIKQKNDHIKQKEKRIIQLQNQLENMSLHQQQLKRQVQQLKQSLELQLEQKKQYKHKIVEMKNKFDQSNSERYQKFQKFEELLSCQIINNKISSGQSIFQQIISQKDAIIQKQRVDMLARIDQFNAEKTKMNKLFSQNDQVQCHNYQKILAEKEKLIFENKELKLKVKELQTQLSTEKTSLTHKIQELNNLLYHHDNEFQKKMQENISNFSELKDKLEQACLNKDALIRKQAKQIEQLEINVTVLKNQRELKDNLISEQQHKLFKFDLELQQKTMQYQREKKLLNSKILHLQSQLTKYKNQYIEEKIKFQGVLAQLRGQNTSNQTVHKQQRKKLLQNMENKLEEAILIHFSDSKPKQRSSINQNKTGQKKLDRPKLNILVGNKFNLN